MHQLRVLVTQYSPVDAMETPINKIVTSYGDKEARHIYNSGQIEMLTKPIDIFMWIHAIEVQKQQKRAKQKRKAILIIFLTVALLIGGIVIYNLPVFEEMRLWNKIEDEHNISDIEDYIIFFEDGEHYEHARFLELEYGDFTLYKYQEFMEEFPNSKYNDRLHKLYEQYEFNSIASSSSIMDIHKFIEQFPNSEYHSQVMSLYDEKWQKVIDDYNKLNEGNSNKKGVKFMTELLQHLCDNQISVIYLNVQIVNNIKNYDDYSEKVRAYCEEYQRYSSIRPIESHIVSTKDSFSESYIQSTEEAIKSELTRMFTDIAGMPIVKVKSIADDVEATSSNPIISLTCTIYNQENYQPNMRIYVPAIWTETEQTQYSSFTMIESSTVVFKQYLLGIQIDFKTNITFPGATADFSHKGSGELAEAYESIPKDGNRYELLTTKCIDDYTCKLKKSINGN